MDQPPSAMSLSEIMDLDY